MARTSTDTSEAGQVKLDAVLDLGAAAPLARQFADLRDGDIVVEAGEVERLGSQCVQILLSAKKTWDDAGKTFTLSDPSDQFVEGLEVLGLSQSHFQ